MYIHMFACLGKKKKSGRIQKTHLRTNKVIASKE